MLSASLKALDSITILNPDDNDTVSGQPLSINGTSSLANAYVRLIINTTEIGYVLTDAYGDWSVSSSDLADGSYIIYAYLIDGVKTLATAQHVFTIENPYSYE